MNNRIKDIVNEHLFQHLEKDKLMEMLDIRFRSINAKIDAFVSQPVIKNSIEDKFVKKMGFKNG